MKSSLFVGDDGALDQEPQKPFWEEALEALLEPYEPAKKESEADRWPTTMDLIQSIELHYATPQGQTPFGPVNLITAQEFVQKMKDLGFHAVNMGAMSLHWLLKTRTGDK